MLRINSLRDKKGARTGRKRVGRGVGSGYGKTCGRGHKGQKSRSGVALKGFEGGQMPIHMRLPKRGFNPLRRKRYSWLNLGRIAEALEQGRLDPTKPVDEAILVAAGLVRKQRDGVRILADGKLSAAIELSVSSASGPAIAAIEKAGGKITLLAAKPSPKPEPDPEPDATSR